MSYYERNKEKVKLYYEKNKERIKEYYKQNKHDISIYNRNYWSENKWKYDDRYEYNYVRKTLFQIDKNDILKNQEINENGFIVRF